MYTARSITSDIVYLTNVKNKSKKYVDFLIANYVYYILY